MKQDYLKKKNFIEYYNNKYMKYYDKNKESSCPKYWDVNNLYSWAISQKRKK